MYSLSVLKSLILSGWTPWRRVSTIAWTSQLETEGYKISEESIRIMRSLGGIFLADRKAQSGGYYLDSILFDPLEGGSGEQDRIAYWEAQLGLQLTPIGVIRGWGILLVAHDGSIYANWCEAIYHCGDTIDDALNQTLLTGYRCPTIVGSADSSDVGDH